MFIKPKELKTFLLNAGFSPGAMTGFAPRFSPTALVNSTLSSAKAESSHKRNSAIRMGPSYFKDGLYMGWAEK